MVGSASWALSAGSAPHHREPGESDVDVAGFYWAADSSYDPFWWNGSGFRLAGAYATLSDSGLHIKSW